MFNSSASVQWLIMSLMIWFLTKLHVVELGPFLWNFAYYLHVPTLCPPNSSYSFQAIYWSNFVFYSKGAHIIRILISFQFSAGSIIHVCVLQTQQMHESLSHCLHLNFRCPSAVQSHINLFSCYYMYMYTMYIYIVYVAVGQIS